MAHPNDVANSLVPGCNASPQRLVCSPAQLCKGFHRERRGSDNDGNLLLLFYSVAAFARLLRFPLLWHLRIEELMPFRAESTNMPPLDNLQALPDEIYMSCWREI